MLTFEGVQAQGAAAIVQKLLVCNLFSEIFYSLPPGKWGKGCISPDLFVLLLLFVDLAISNCSTCSNNW
jgi:hypothetical protein